MRVRGRSRKEQKNDQIRTYNIMERENKASRQAQAAFHHKAFGIPSQNKKMESDKD